ncbi:hypothetical protein HGRIS_010232 [Hohenbuehelia grisea]|uniref:Thioredoxin domain-containing protein n=1 Tax=Hohenbuehelia grisea TaxID=104357 RepID=A0ABR3J420_9AGAR
MAADELYPLSAKLRFAKVNCQYEYELCEAHEIKAYPTLRIFKHKQWHQYNGTTKAHINPDGLGLVEYMLREYDSLSQADTTEGQSQEDAVVSPSERTQEEIHSEQHDSESTFRFSWPDSRPILYSTFSHVITLTAETFNWFIRRTDLVLVQYYIPTSEDCKDLAEPYNNVAWAFNNRVDGVQIVAVDCLVDARLCQAHNITEYPTLRIFKCGQQHPIIDAYDLSTKKAGGGLIEYMTRASERFREVKWEEGSSCWDNYRYRADRGPVKAALPSGPSQSEA